MAKKKTEEPTTEKKVISELTPEQIAQFPQYVDEWTAIGLCTEPADRPRAERAIREMYANASTEASPLGDPVIVWGLSPVHILVQRAALAVAQQPFVPSDFAPDGSLLAQTKRADDDDMDEDDAEDQEPAAENAEASASAPALSETERNKYPRLYQIFRELEKRGKLDILGPRYDKMFGQLPLALLD